MKIVSALRMFLWLTLLAGIVYPLIITGIAQLTMKQKANGGFLSLKGKAVGAALIAQKFENEKYFWPRPSSIDYNPLPSGGSNLGPTSTDLRKVVEERRQFNAKAYGLADTNQIPSELLFSSGSGLDPHISPATALFQLDRVAKARHLDENGKKMLHNLIENFTENRLFGFIGEPYINVLQLNIALDQMSKN